MLPSDRLMFTALTRKVHEYPPRVLFSRQVTGCDLPADVL